MPLIKRASKKAMEHNIKAEMHAGKPQKQAIAIAYDVKRRAARKKMAKGGEVNFHDEHKADIDNAKDKREMKMMDAHPDKHKAEMDERDEGMMGIDDAHDDMEMEMLDEHPKRHKDELSAVHEHHAVADDAEDDLDMAMMADGGMLENEDERVVDIFDHDMHEDAASIADMIRKHKKMQMLAEGGEVDLQANADEDLNLEDQLSFDAARKKTYFDDSQIDEQPMDSNEHGDEIDKDDHDMVSQIRQKIRAKQKARI